MLHKCVAFQVEGLLMLISAYFSTVETSSASSLSDYHTAIVCEEGTIKIQCAPQQVVKIIYGNETGSIYGRFDSLDKNKTTGVRICDNESIAEDHKCILHDFSELDKDCEGEPTCLIRATNGNFGKTSSGEDDPCPNVPKYLKLMWTCAEDASTAMQPAFLLILLSIAISNKFSL